MPWLRVDDGFTLHPKLVQLQRSERWTWMELLCYCARYRTEGEIPVAIAEALPKANKAFLAKCVQIGLLDEDEDGGIRIHDWKEYNPSDPTGATRQMRHRNRNRNGEVTDDVTETVTEGTVTDVTPRARAGARGPSRPLIEHLPTEPKDQAGLVGRDILRDIA